MELSRDGNISVITYDPDSSEECNVASTTKYQELDDRQFVISVPMRESKVVDERVCLTIRKSENSDEGGHYRFVGYEVIDTLGRLDRDARRSRLVLDGGSELNVSGIHVRVAQEALSLIDQIEDEF